MYGMRDLLWIYEAPLKFVPGQLVNSLEITQSRNSIRNGSNLSLLSEACNVWIKPIVRTYGVLSTYCNYL